MDVLAAKERLGKAFAYLRTFNPDLTLADIAREMALSYATVRNGFAPNTSYLSQSFLEQFAKSFGRVFNKEWILEGTGPTVVEEPELPDPDLALRWQRVAYIMSKEKLDHVSMSKKLGLKSNTTISRIVSGVTKPQDRTMELIHTHFPDYLERWLYLGLGPITKWSQLQPSLSPLSREEVERVASGEESPEAMYRLLSMLEGRGQSNGVAYIPTASSEYELMEDSASAGPWRGFIEHFPDEPKCLYNIPVEKFHSGEYRLFRVKGTSMDNGDIMDLAHDDLVLVRHIDRTYWRQGLHRHNWRYFVFVTIDEGIVIKEVINQDLENDTYTLHSHNPDYSDFTLHGSQIVAIYNVIQVVERRLNL